MGAGWQRLRPQARSRSQGRVTGGGPGNRGGPGPTRLERLLTLRDLARNVLATLEAGDLVLDDAMDFDLAAERFCQACEEVRLLDGLLDASAGLPVAA